MRQRRADGSLGCNDERRKRKKRSSRSDGEKENKIIEREWGKKGDRHRSMLGVPRASGVRRRIKTNANYARTYLALKYAC